ncbi:DUF2523 family protein [Marinobacter daepoensis]|uniref:DUF2523 family protein n=1 Tax=Marinobacter daepoensis TaxID=262077 RepID=UPI000400C491|nr:DUF2523 family protein [Marinobacter daepoensis]
MPLIQFIWAIIVSAIPWVVSKLMRAIGLGFVTYVGLSLGVEQAEQFIFDRFNNLGTELYQILAIAGFPQGIKILFAAFAAALVLKNAGTGDRLRKPVWKKPGPFEA